MTLFVVAADVDLRAKKRVLIHKEEDRDTFDDGLVPSTSVLASL
jgi:hypothetical protein